MPPKRRAQQPSGPVTKKRLRARANQATPTGFDPPPVPDNLAVLSEEINMLGAQNESLRDSLGELQDRLASFEDKFTDILERPQAHSPRGQLNISGNGTSHSPIELIRTHFPWLETPTIDNIVSCTLEVSHLIRLIPLEERSKAQITPPGINFDIESGKPTVTTELNIAYEKSLLCSPIHLRRRSHGHRLRNQCTYSSSFLVVSFPISLERYPDVRNSIP